MSIFLASFATVALFASVMAVLCEFFNTRDK
jgi:hypothetical protein